MTILVTLHTSGDGCWSSAKKLVNITGLEVPYFDGEYTGELLVCFDDSWDVKSDGLIYTDLLFEKELKVWLTAQGYDASDVEYSEQGMQGVNYVSLDVGEAFLKSWSAKKSEEVICDSEKKVVETKEMAVAKFIMDLEDDNGRLAKEAVLKKAVERAAKGCTEATVFLKCAQLAYDPYSKWGVKQVAEGTGGTTEVGAWQEFFDLLEALKKRELTGNAARDAIVAASKLFSADDWNLVCRRVLIKDLRAGITATTLNKFVPDEFQVPGFGVQLATDSKGKPKRMTGIKRLEYKLDGVRMVAIVQNGTVSLMSRNGKELENFPAISNAIENIANQFATDFPLGFVLDGEVMGQSFQDLMKQARRKSDVQTDSMVYNVFDIIDLEAFETGTWNKTQADRTTIIENFRILLEGTGCIKVSDGFNVDLDTEQGHKELDAYFEKAVSEGLEGIMIKDVDAVYSCKRTDAWLKLKPALTVDLTVIDVEEGTGRNAGRMGALVCEGVDMGLKINVNVGSGYSDTQRDEYWDARADIVGQVVEVMADSVTQNQDGSFSMRFPRFVRFRGFEAGEKM